MNKTIALHERARVMSLLEKETDESKRYHMERYIGDLNQFYINRKEE